jgi:hypothetical protein
MEVALETEGQAVCTVVTADFPSKIAVAFTARPTRQPGFLQGLFDQDISVGDPAFDKLYIVTGTPVDAVREALSRKGLLDVLKELGARTMDVQLNRRQLYFRLPGASRRADEIEWLVEMGCKASRELFGEVGGLGPYC